MDDSTRFRPEAAEAMEPRDPGELNGAAATARSSRPSAPFVGDAMRALLLSGDVRIERGDATRVIAKGESDAIATSAPAGSALAPAVTTSAGAGAGAGDTQHVRRSARDAEAMAATASTRPTGSSQPASVPPGPHVDGALWTVLALGLFMIAGWMMLQAL